MKYLSHAITGIISFVLAIYISIFAFGFFENEFYFGELVLLLIILVLIYIVVFYPIDYIVKSVKHAKDGDLSYTIRDYIQDNEITTDAISSTKNFIGYGTWRHSPAYLIYLYFIIILSIVNIIIVLPVKGITYLISRNKR